MLVEFRYMYLCTYKFDKHAYRIPTQKRCARHDGWVNIVEFTFGLVDINPYNRVRLVKFPAGF